MSVTVDKILAFLSDKPTTELFGRERPIIDNEGFEEIKKVASKGRIKCHVTHPDIQGVRRGVFIRNNKGFGHFYIKQ